MKKKSLLNVEVNPIKHYNAITTRSGKDLEEREKVSEVEKKWRKYKKREWRKNKWEKLLERSGGNKKEERGGWKKW